MRSIILRHTDIKVSRLSFGTSRLHRLYSSRARLNVLSAAYEQGITHYDTSPYYGYGIAEIELGKFVRSHHSQITISTKFGLYPPFESSIGGFNVLAGKAAGRFFPDLSNPIVDWSVKRAQKSLELSLKRLGMECISILMLHEPQLNMINSDDIFSWLMKEKDRGNISAWGLSGNSVSIRPWLGIDHPLDMILQVSDSIEDGDADDLRSEGHEPQITFGYISTSFHSNPRPEVGSVIQSALKKNKNGSVLVSATSVKHIHEICAVTEED